MNRVVHFTAAAGASLPWPVTVAVTISVIVRPVCRVVVLSLLLYVVTASAQTVPPVPFSVELVERRQVDAPALHSSAVGVWEGRWLFLGGRISGLHGFGSSPFPASGRNVSAVVYDPVLDRRWDAPLTSLPDTVAAALQTTNAQFHQHGRTLYVVGGYGHDPRLGDHRTFATLTAVDVPGLIEAVVAGADPSRFVRQVVDERLAVTGGHLLPLGERYYLLGGHRFDGLYLSGHSPRQQYTDAVRSFALVDDGDALTVEDFSEIHDAGALHRRDGNAAGIRYPDGTDGLALYGGVFSPTDLPYKTPVYVGPDGFVEDAGFEQRIGHYTCPVLPIYDAATGAMHTVFFGGMGQDYVDAATGAWASDRYLPFIDDVAVTSRAPGGATAEPVLPWRMPGFLGTNAVLILADGVPHTETGVVLLEALGETTLVGQIHGGIEATGRHPGVLGLGTSFASARVFDVYVRVRRSSGTGGEELPGRLALSAPAPNPARGSTRLTLTLHRPGPVAVEVFDALGRRVLAPSPERTLPAGPGEVRLDLETLPPGTYFVRVRSADGVASRSFVHQP